MPHSSGRPYDRIPCSACDGQRTKLTLVETLQLENARLRAVVGTAAAHRDARRNLNAHMKAGRSITFDHPLWRTVNETEARMDTALDAMEG